MSCSFPFLLPGVKESPLAGEISRQRRRKETGDRTGRAVQGSREKTGKKRK